MKMSNMHYCRFQNTARDLQDCLDDIDASFENDDIEITQYVHELSDDERHAFNRLVSRARRLIDLANDIEQDVSKAEFAAWGSPRNA
jgi:hypothetical protein